MYSAGLGLRLMNDEVDETEGKWIWEKLRGCQECASEHPCTTIAKVDINCIIISIDEER
jgi:hypothetical protein